MPDDRMIADERPQKHRAGAWAVLLMGIIALGLGLTQWRGSFSKAFARSTDGYKTPDQLERERLEETKAQDTDGDGLNDYEESRVYQTSPYLADSDSDGVEDKAELAKGDDPNCPTGKVCGGLGQASADAATGSASAAAQLAEEEKKALEQFMNPTPDQVRQLLIQAGVKPEELQGIDDATLLELYRQSLVEAQANLSTQP